MAVIRPSRATLLAFKNLLARGNTSGFIKISTDKNRKAKK
jgi:hypothetical protein